ncbi:esterase [Lithospermum erythrorhizon]|uniref:Pectinesterase n=1 Tax=Lithospermum erythrorhizon TaxID=34254 RepID=A0AAV3QGV1_LITER
MGHNRRCRTIVYVKAGIYHEKMEIGRDLKNVMFVGDGIDRTIVTGNKNVVDGVSQPHLVSLVMVFCARDMTFENTAGPHKHQAVALSVSSGLSVFYHCSFKGYQDTLLAHSLRQFYRDCHVYGTVDFIFGDAVAVLQNCDIFRGDLALSTLYYGEFMNIGSGASTTGRVQWPGFLVLHDFHEASPFTVRNFIQGHVWLPATGVPFSADI